MKKCGLLFLLLLFLFSFPVSAEEVDSFYAQQLEAAGAEDLWNTLSEDTRELYRQIGVDSVSDLGDLTVQPQTMLSSLAETVAAESRQPLMIAGMLIAAVVLCAYLSGTRDTVSSSGMSTVYSQVSILAVCAVLLVPFAGLIEKVQEALSGTAVFLGSFTPVYIAVLAAGGQWQTALSYQSVLLLFSQLLTLVTDKVMMPVLLCALALGMVSAVSDTGNLGKLGERLLKTGSWGLGILSAVFTALLSVNTLLGSAKDTLGNRMIKLSISSFVPVVGNAVSEAYLTVRSCLTLVKSTVGVFGIVTAGMLLAPAMIGCITWLISLWITSMAAEVFDQKEIAGFLKTVTGVVKAMLAILSLSAVFMIVTTAVVLLAGRESV